MSPLRLIILLQLLLLAAMVLAAPKLTKCPRDCLNDVKNRIRKSTSATEKDNVCNAPEEFKECLQKHKIFTASAKKLYSQLKRIIRLPCHLVSQGINVNEDELESLT